MNKNKLIELIIFLTGLILMAIGWYLTTITELKIISTPYYPYTSGYIETPYYGLGIAVMILGIFVFLFGIIYLFILKKKSAAQ